MTLTIVIDTTKPNPQTKYYKSMTLYQSINKVEEQIRN